MSPRSGCVTFFASISGVACRMTARFHSRTPENAPSAARTDAGVADEERIIFLPAAEHLDGAQHLPREQVFEQGFRLALGDGDPVAHGLEHALGPGILCPVVAGDVVRSQGLDPGDADRLAPRRRILRTVVGVQAVRGGHGELAVGIVPLAIARRRHEHAHHRVDVVVHAPLEHALVAHEDAALDAGRLRVLPHVHGTDGAFAARLRRRSA